MALAGRIGSTCVWRCTRSETRCGNDPARLRIAMAQHRHTPHQRHSRLLVARSASIQCRHVCCCFAAVPEPQCELVAEGGGQPSKCGADVGRARDYPPHKQGAAAEQRRRRWGGSQKQGGGRERQAGGCWRQRGGRQQPERGQRHQQSPCRSRQGRHDACLARVGENTWSKPNQVAHSEAGELMMGRCMTRGA